MTTFRAYLTCYLWALDASCHWCSNKGWSFWFKLPYKAHWIAYKSIYCDRMHERQN